VTFAVPATGATASLSRSSATTDADGAAEVSLVAGTVVGTFELSASTAGAAGAAITTLEVLAIPTTITATADGAPVDASATITVAVGASVGVPSGTVEIVGLDGTRQASATLVAGAATIPVAGLPIGTHTLVVRYPAQGSYGASASTELTVEITEDSGSISGGGCNAGGAQGGWLLALVLGAALALRRRRVLAGALGVLGLIGVASAQPAGARAVDLYHAASPESAWFALDSVSFTGAREVTLGLVGDYAREPLDTYEADGSVRDRVVSDAFIVQFGGSVVLRDRFRLSSTVPMSPWQAGDGGVYNGMALASPTFAFGDVTVAGDARVFGAPGDRLRIAVGTRFALPTGSRTNYMSDGRFAVEPRVLAAGSAGALEYAAGASAFLRERSTMAGETFASELRYEAGAGAHLLSRRLFVGPELVGAAPLASDTDVGTPLELRVGGRFRATARLRVGLAVSAGLVNAVGAPTWRTLAALSWSP
jgi:MYXO-CTERM domain-containing protein